MKNHEDNSDSPTLSFSGAAALLLFVAAFCAYPLGAYTPATIFAVLAFATLSLAAPESARRPVAVRVRARRHDEHVGPSALER